jgi:hypothetical protein
LGDNALQWFQDRLSEMSNLAGALSGVINDEFTEAWGPSGMPGSPELILSTCGLLAEGCQQLLTWEENVRFTHVPPGDEDLNELLAGVGGRILGQVGLIPAEMAKIFSEEKPTGAHNIAIVIDLPEHWVERCEAAIARVAAARGD